MSEPAGNLGGPPRPTCAASPVGSLVIENTEADVRLWLRISGELNEDVMVFGQEPCNSGRRKRRNVAYLGLLPPLIDGLSDITDLYKARHGEPRPGTRVFIVTCQQQDGWKALDRETSYLVPEPPTGQQAASEPADSQIPHMHKGDTGDAQGIGQSVVSQPPRGIETETGGREAAAAALGQSRIAGGESGASG